MSEPTEGWKLLNDQIHGIGHLADDIQVILRQIRGGELVMSEDQAKRLLTHLTDLNNELLLTMMTDIARDAARGAVNHPVS